MGARRSLPAREGVGREVDRGFTLIEILIVVTIIILVFGFAMPTIGAFLSNQKLKAVSGRLAGSLLIARTRAITKHQDVYIIFLPDRLMIASSRLEVPEFREYFASAREAAKMTIYLRFADAYVSEKANKEHPYGLTSDLASLPEDEDWTQPVTAKIVLESGLSGGKKAFLRFRSDGTVEFGGGSGPGDRLSIEFWADPPRDADIIVEEMANKAKEWIDVRATGNVDSRLKEGDPKVSLEIEEGES